MNAYLDEVAERVTRGAEWLDANVPGWVERVDVETLDLQSPCRCVLGQLYEDFDAAPVEVRGEEGFILGFDSDFDVWYIEQYFGDLTAEWRRLILARRGAS